MWLVDLPHSDGTAVHIAFRLRGAVRVLAVFCFVNVSIPMGVGRIMVRIKHSRCKKNLYDNLRKKTSLQRTFQAEHALNINGWMMEQITHTCT